MNKRLIPLLILLMAFAGATTQSCKKEGCTDEKAKDDDGSCVFDDDHGHDHDRDHDHDNSSDKPVSINITEPATGATYKKDSVVNVTFTANTEGEIHGFQVVITNTSDGNTVVYDSGKLHDHSSPLNKSKTWTNNVTMHSDMNAQIKVFKDHDHETFEEASVTFHAHPM